MPIRFRCAYCNQLMGISTRKAGTVVRCPKCAGEIIVPVPEGMEAPAEPPPPPPPPASSVAPAFEDRNFEQNLNPLTNGPTETGPAPPPVPMPPPPMPSPPARRLGLFLPLGMLLVSLVVIVLLLVLMFVVGLIIGRATVISDTQAAAVSSFAVRQNQPCACPLFSGSVKNPQRSAWSCT